MIVEVACPIPVFKTFDYRLPASIYSGEISELIGRRLLVPFGPRVVAALVCGVKSGAEGGDTRLKDAKAVIDQQPVLSTELMSLGRWLSERYVCGPGEGLFSLIPRGLKAWQSGSLPESHPPSEGNVPAHQNDLQRQAIETIRYSIYSERPSAFVLFGGPRRPVYWAATKDVLAKGQTVIVVSPEIEQAQHLVSEAQQLFGASHVGFLHSDLTQKEQREQWSKCRRGEISILVGARSAVLAPMPHLGLILIDDEHSASLKEERKPRFHAREVAMHRTKLNNACLILGSDTPSLETYHQAKSGQLKLIDLKRPAAGSLPSIRIIDLKSEKRRGLLSPTLKEMISESLSRKTKTILVLNRKGYFQFSRCPHCGWLAKCDQCDIALVTHKAGSRHSREGGNPVVDISENKRGFPTGAFGNDDTYELRDAANKSKGRLKRKVVLICRYCLRTTHLPHSCPACGQKKLFSGGYGTERLSQEIHEDFPWARVLRWDADARKQTEKAAEIESAIRKGEFDVLIGTQLAVHAFQLPSISLIALVDIDGPLSLPDFRSAERTVQFVGNMRAEATGHLVDGSFVIQAKKVDHYAIHYIVTNDYRGFCDEELKHRQDLNYPPFSRLVLVLFHDVPREGQVVNSDKFVDWVANLELPSAVGILGPARARRVGKTGRFNTQILLKVPEDSVDALLSKLPEFLPAHGPYKIDVDPEQ